MYIVNFGCVLVFMTGILKNFDFFENFRFFLKNFFQKISHKKSKLILFKYLLPKVS